MKPIVVALVAAALAHNPKSILKAADHPRGDAGGVRFDRTHTVHEIPSRKQEARANGWMARFRDTVVSKVLRGSRGAKFGSYHEPSKDEADERRGRVEMRAPEDGAFTPQVHERFYYAFRSALRKTSKRKLRFAFHEEDLGCLWLYCHRQDTSAALAPLAIHQLMYKLWIQSMMDNANRHEIVRGNYRCALEYQQGSICDSPPIDFSV